MQRRQGSVLAITVAAMAVAAAPAAAETVYGVTASSDLVTFDSASPGTITSTVPIDGLPAGETVAGIDVRPGTLRLTVLDSAGRLYTLDAQSGALTAVAMTGGAPFADALDIDFNPTVDRVRVVGQAGDGARTNPAGPDNGNGRLNPSNGAVGGVDNNIAFGGADANAGDVPVVPSTAYTNAVPASAAYPNPPATTQFDLEAGNDVLVRQAPPNDGTLTTVGALGVDVTRNGASGFDIVTDADGTTNRGYAALGTAAAPGFYSVDLTTGAATKVGDFPAASPVVDIAVAPVVPTLLALREIGGRQTLTAFAANRPQDAGENSVRVTGLPAGVTLEGIDQRPRDGQLYGLGSDSRLYTVNVLTGATSPIGTGPFTPALSGTQFGFDVNPVADRIRVVSDTGQSLRINPDTGVGAVAPPSAADGSLNGFSASATGAAYTNSVKAPAATTLFDIDSATDRLLLQDPPNAGTTADAGALGQGGSTVDVTPSNGYDIVARFNQGFAVGANGLVAVNVASTAPVAPATLARANGGAVVVGPFPLGVGETVTGLAAFDAALIPPAPTPPAPGTTPPGATPPVTIPGNVKLRTRISASLKPARDRRSPLRYTLSGRIVPKGTAAAGAFKGGRVTVRAKRTGRTKTLKTVRTTVSATGRFSVRITVPGKNLAKRGGQLTLHQGFSGTDTLFSARALDRARYR